MPEDSPPPFIVFRTPKATQVPEAPQALQASRRAATMSPYDRGLAIVGVVSELVSKATARFYLKDRLDRAATQLVFELGRAAAASPSARWRNYRAAQDYAAIVVTVLDILHAQKAAPGEEIARALTLVRELMEDLAPRTNG